MLRYQWNQSSGEQQAEIIFTVKSMVSYLNNIGISIFTVAKNNSNGFQECSWLGLASHQEHAPESPK